MKTSKEIWKCECGNEDQEKIIFALDGEEVCGKCGIVLGRITGEPLSDQAKTDAWDSEADLRRKILEERVSRNGWQF